MAFEQRQRNSRREPEGGTSVAVIAPGETFGAVTDQITSIVLTRPTPLFWYLTVGIGVIGVGFFIVSAWWLLYQGIGVFGTEIPVAWAYPITNFVWWI